MAASCAAVSRSSYNSGTVQKNSLSPNEVLDVKICCINKVNLVATGSVVCVVSRPSSSDSSDNTPP